MIKIARILFKRHTNWLVLKQGLKSTAAKLKQIMKFYKFHTYQLDIKRTNKHKKQSISDKRKKKTTQMLPILTTLQVTLVNFF